jgi:arylsulfatase A-like enzyme
MALMNALMLEVPALHLGYLGCYGNEWVATPALDRLAAQSIVFDWHMADSLDPLPSDWTGRYSFPGPGEDAAREDHPTHGLNALLRAAGIRFTHVGPSPRAEGAADGTALERTLEAALVALDDLRGAERWLLWAELPPLVPPWELPEDFRDRYFTRAPEEDSEEGEGPPEPLLDPPGGPLDAEDFELWERIQLTYAGVVSYLDTSLGVFLEELGRLPEEPLLILTARRGLALGEHGILGDERPWLHDEVIHLPLIVRLPGGAEAGRRIAALTQPADLYATLLETFGLPVPETAHGRSLWPLLRGEAEQVRPYACAGWERGGAVEWALRTPAWGFLLPVLVPPGDRPREPHLYVKPDDRWEVNDVRQHHLELVDHLEGVLRGFVAAARRPGPLAAPALRDVEAELAQVPAAPGPKSTQEGS